MFRWMILAALIATPAIAQEGDGASSEPPKRVRSVILFGDDQCPKPENADEVVVCAKSTESPYRIPSKLRETKARPANESWARRADAIEDVARLSRPGSCSVVGTAGQTGCHLQMTQDWAAEKAAKKRANPDN
jgi:hypothetical protein